MNLENINLKELFILNDKKFSQYHTVLNHVQPRFINPNTKEQSITSLTFAEVSEIKNNLKNPDFENTIKTFQLAFRLNKNKVLNIKSVEFFEGLNWIKKEVNEVYQREQSNLSESTDTKLKEAGIERLNVFGDLNTLISLGKEYSKSPTEIEQWAYELVFALVLHQKISREITTKLSSND